jgi:hypothetical protein
MAPQYCHLTQNAIRDTNWDPVAADALPDHRPCGQATKHLRARMTETLADPVVLTADDDFCV